MRSKSFLLLALFLGLVSAVRADKPTITVSTNNTPLYPPADGVALVRSRRLGALKAE
ncbi:MAG: hypothetical protein HZB40_18965 [Rhodocyclales bacterium]|nr:hypothetical protein [Rhodocyclales bacterium]